MSTLKFGPLAVRPHVRNGKPSGRWQVDTPPHLTASGKRERQLFPTKAKAIEEAKRRLREIQVQGAVSGAFRLPSTGFRLDEIVEQWTKDQEARVVTLKKRANTLVSELYRLKAVLAFMGTDDIAAINDRRIADYQKDRLDAGRSPETINREVATLLSVLGWAKKRKLLRELPECEPIPVFPKVYDLPTPEEATRILKYLPGWKRVLVHLLAETGCRPSEAFALMWDDVDVVNGTITIRAREGYTPKTRYSQRTIHVSPALLTGLRMLDTKSPYVFPGRHNRKKSSAPEKPVSTIRRALAAAVKKAGITRNGKPLKITPKLFRKAHITWQQERGIPVAVVQSMVGHAPGSRVTFRNYTAIGAEARKMAVLALPTSAELVEPTAARCDETKAKASSSYRR